jgi:hypothetical protein
MSFNKLDHSFEGEILPRFRLKIQAEKSELFAQIKSAAIEDNAVSGTYADNYIILRIPSWERHYWSPELQIQTTPDWEDDSYSILRCVVGPTQSVWVMFVFFYSITILLTVFGGMFALVQYSVSKTSDFLWIWPIGILLVVSLFVVSKLGQRKARNQTLHLVSFLRHTLEQKWEVERVE